MNFILYFGIIFICAVHVHSRTNEPPSQNDLLFLNQFKPQDRETKNGINVRLGTQSEDANDINTPNSVFDIFFPHKERKVGKESNTDKYIVDIPKLLRDPTPAKNGHIVEPSEAIKEIDFRELLKKISPQGYEEFEVSESPENPDKGNDFPKLFRGLLSPGKQMAEKEAETPSKNEIEFDLSELLPYLMPVKNGQNVGQKEDVLLETPKGIDLRELLENMSSQGYKEFEVVPESPKKTDETFNFARLLRDLLAAPEKRMEETKADNPSQNGIEIDISELLHGRVPAKNGKTVNQKKAPTGTLKEFNLRELFKNTSPHEYEYLETVPKSFKKTDEKQSIGERTELLDLLNGLFGQNVAPKPPTKINKQEEGMGQVSKPTSNAETNIEISELLNDLFSPQNVEAIEVIPKASQKAGTDSDIPDHLITVIPQRKEPEGPLVTKTDEGVVSIVPLSGLTLDEKEEKLPEPDLTSKINDLISNVVSPLEQRLLDEFERTIVPLNDIIELGANTRNSPFTEAEIKKLDLFKVYIQTMQESYSEFKSKVHAFGVNRFYQTAVHKNYFLSKQQKSHTMNVLNDAIERVKAESNAIYDLILKPKNQQLIKSIENKKLELSASLRAISLGLRANDAHLIDDEKMQQVKTKRLSIIYENSKTLLEILQSKDVESLVNGITKHVDELAGIMIKLPMKITLSYMY